jgi:hypothetical protein
MTRVARLNILIYIHLLIFLILFLVNIYNFFSFIYTNDSCFRYGHKIFDLYLGFFYVKSLV